MVLFPPEYLDKRQVALSFNRAVPTYEHHSKVQKWVGENLLEHLEGVKIEPQRILDVGTGIGRLGHALSKKYPKSYIYSIDISLNMLTKARQKASRWFSKQHFTCADATQLPIADNSIDLLISNLMLQWCNDIHVAFAEFARVLKPEGALFFSTFGPDTLKELRHSWATVDNASHVNRFFDIHDIGNALLQVGLTHPVMDTDWLQLAYSDVKQLMKELKNIGAHNITAGRPRGLMGKTKFQAMLAAYEQYRSTLGTVPATYEIIYGHTRGKKQVDSAAMTTVTIPLSHLGGKKK